MQPRVVALILLFLVQHVDAAFSQEPLTSFSESSTAITPERSLGFKIDGGNRLSIASYRFKPKAGLTKWFMAQWCGVTIMTGHSTSKPILVIGTGQTDTLTCLGLEDAGPMPSRGPEKRVGLVYRTASPNFQSITSVLLVLDPVTGDWRIDHSHDDEFGQLQPEPTIVSMRYILSKSAN